MNSLEVWTSVGDVWLDDSQHVLGSLVHLDKDSVVDLSESHQMEALPDLGGDLVDTTDSHDEGELGLSSNIVVSLLLGLTPQSNLISLLILVFLGELLGSLEDLNTLLLAIDLSLDSELGSISSILCLPLATLEDGLWDGGELCVGHSSLVEVNQALLS